MVKSDATSSPNEISVQWVVRKSRIYKFSRRKLRRDQRHRLGHRLQQAVGPPEVGRALSGIHRPARLRRPVLITESELPAD